MLCCFVRDYKVAHCLVVGLPTAVFLKIVSTDMQAFKAANPECMLEDFVQWHSPRDWIEGKLSGRLTQPGNLWVQLWEVSTTMWFSPTLSCWHSQEAQPVPVAKQKPLFDSTTQAEKVTGM